LKAVLPHIRVILFFSAMGNRMGWFLDNPVSTTHYFPIMIQRRNFLQAAAWGAGSVSSMSFAKGSRPRAGVAVHS